MNWLDLVIVVCIAVGVIKGLFDGIIKQVVSLVGLILAILFAGGLATLLQPFAEKFGFIPGYWVYPVCYVISFTLIIVLMVFLGRLIEKIWELTPFGFLNNLAGGLAGMLIVVLILSLVFNFFIVFDKNSQIISEQSKQESVLFGKVRAVVPTLYPYVRKKVEEGFKDFPYGKDQNEERIQDEPKQEEEKEEEPVEPKKQEDKKRKDIFDI